MEKIGSITCGSRDTITVEVLDTPSVAAPYDLVACSGETVELAATDCNNCSCFWTASGGVINDPLQCNPAITAGAAGTSNYFVAVTDANSCSSRTNIRLETVANPTAIVPADSIETCIGDAAIVLTGDGGQCQWTDSDGTVFPAGCEITADSIISKDYTLLVTNESMGRSCTDEATVSITVLPVPSLTLDDFSICEGDTISLDALSECPDCSCFWEMNDDITDPTACKQKFVPTASADLIATIMDMNNCQNSDTSVLTVIPIPQVKAFNDHFVMRKNQLELFDVGANDSLDAGGVWIFEALTDPGIGIEAERWTTREGVVRLVASDSLGLTSFRYRWSDELCGMEDEAIAEVLVIEDDKVCICDPALEPVGCPILPEVAELYPDNRISIFDRGGRVVHTATPYANNWRGIDIRSGDPVPSGSYYFVLELGEDIFGDIGGTIRGVILIARESGG